ncbi:MAG: hypothetical protein AAFQ84_08605 [Pseudomonadota bacterium]
MINSLKTTSYFALAAVIGLGPLLPQTFEIGEPWLRPWVMFSRVGVGVLQGEFEANWTDGTTTTLAPLDVIGIRGYFKWRQADKAVYVQKPDDIYDVVSEFCNGHESRLQRLSFTGRVGGFEGWVPLHSDDLCNFERGNG